MNEEMNDRSGGSKCQAHVSGQLDTKTANNERYFHGIDRLDPD